VLRCEFHVMLFCKVRKECTLLHKLFYIHKEKLTLCHSQRPFPTLHHTQTQQQHVRCCSNKSQIEEEKKETLVDNDGGDSLVVQEDREKRQQYIRDVLFSQFKYQKPYHKTAKNVDYNVIYNKNTFINAARAMEEYLLTQDDLDELRTTTVRTAYSGFASDVKAEPNYLKLDVEKRAVEKWGSVEALEQELRRRRERMEEKERYRRELSALIGDLKKTKKDERRLAIDDFLFGTPAERKVKVEGSAKVVIAAILSNLTNSIMKFGAYFYTGSASMLSEAIHSVADTINQCLLAYGIWESIKQPSVDHPYGWEKSRYIYSLISGCGIFFLGCGFSVYHGLAMFMAPACVESLSIAYSVLAFSFLTDGVSMIMALREVRTSARESGMSIREYVNRGRDPNAVAVLLEDSAALLGIVIASVSLGLTHVTGNSVYDAIGSITIGGLLGMVAVFLIRRNANALVGKSIPPEELKRILTVVENDIMVRSIHDVKATEIGADTIRFKAEINFDGRELTRAHINRVDLGILLQDMKNIDSKEQVENFLLDHGEEIIDLLGQHVDRIEKNIKKQSPEVRHVDLEIL